MLWFRLICRQLANRWGDSSVFSPSALKSSAVATSVPPPRWQIRRSFSRFVKFGSLGALAVSAYITCAYTSDEVRRFRNHIDFQDIDKSKALKTMQEEPEENTTSSESEDLAILESDSSTTFILTVKTVAVFTIDLYLFIRMLTDMLIQENLKPLPAKILPTQLADGKSLTLVLDFNETLVHRDGCECAKRPGFDAFLERVNDYGYEVVLYTDDYRWKVQVFYAKLENKHCFQHIRTKRYNKYKADGKLYRDLSRLNRDPSRILYVSGHALENCLQPENCIPIKPWKKEQGDDTTLTDLLPFLEYVAHECPRDIRPLLSSYKGKDIATEFIKSPEYQQSLKEMWRKKKSYGPRIQVGGLLHATNSSSLKQTCRVISNHWLASKMVDKASDEEAEEKAPMVEEEKFYFDGDCLKEEFYFGS